MPVTSEKTQIAADTPKKVKKSTATATENREVTSSSSVKDKPATSTKKLEKDEQEVEQPVVKTAEKQENADEKDEEKKNEKLDEEKTKLKNKLTRLTRKTTKVRKHSNAKCPSF